MPLEDMVEVLMGQWDATGEEFKFVRHSDEETTRVAAAAGLPGVVAGSDAGGVAGSVPSASPSRL